MKTIEQIPANVPVMLDANIVIYALYPRATHHAICKSLLERGAKGEVHLNIVANTTADVIHRAMIFEVIAQGTLQKSTDAVTHLKNNPQVVQRLVRYKTILRDLRQANINILPLSYQDLHSS